MQDRPVIYHKHSHLLQKWMATALLISTIILAGCTHEKLAETLPEGASYRLLHRWIGDRALDFEILLEPGQEGYEYAITEIRDSVPRIRGNSISAVNRGISQLLTNLKAANFCWEGTRLSLPLVWPQTAADTIRSEVPLRWYGSIWQSTYESTFWDWERWERELDLMALEGVNLLLLTEGSEMVWWKVWRAMGLKDDELDAHFYGPAQLGFQQHGMQIAWQGNSPRSYFQDKAELQKRIINRARELGIRTALPVFSGIVPVPLKNLYPKARVYIDRSSRPIASLDLKDPLYKEIQARYWAEYENVYGRVDYPFCDLFQNAPVTFLSGKVETELEKISQNLRNAILPGLNGRVIWNLEPLKAQPEFWTPENIRILFKAFRDDNVVGLENLNNRNSPVWQQQYLPSRIRTIYTFSLNDGGCNHFAALPDNWSDQYMRLSTQDQFAGWGVQVVGAGNNSIQYHLLNRIAWNSTEFDLNTCREDWCHARYGACKTDLLLAQKLIAESLENPEESNMIRHYGIQRFVLEQNPGLIWSVYRKTGFASYRLKYALQVYLRNYASHADNDLYKIDLMQVANHLLALETDSLLAGAAEKQMLQQFKSRSDFMQEALVNMQYMDRLSAVMGPDIWENRMDQIRSLSSGSGSRNNLMKSFMMMVASIDEQKPAFGARLEHGLLNGWYAANWAFFNEYLNEYHYFNEAEFNLLLAAKQAERLQQKTIEPIENEMTAEQLVEWLIQKYMKEPAI